MLFFRPKPFLIAREEYCIIKVYPNEGGAFTCLWKITSMSECLSIRRGASNPSIEYND